MDLQVQGKVALITGGSKGIGLRAALAFAREGCHVAICARNAGELENAAKQIRSLGVRAATIQADVCNPDEAQRIVGGCLEQLGTLDIFINNVGGGWGRGLLASTEQHWRDTFEINVFAGIRLMRLAVPHMSGRAGASIVHVASISGWQPQLTTPDAQYGASKAAMIFVTEALALDLVRHRVRVNTVSPGSIICEGNGWEAYRDKHPKEFADYVRDGFPMGRLGSPEEVADVIVFLASPRAHWINGRHIPVDGLEQPVPVGTNRTY